MRFAGTHRSGRAATWLATIFMPPYLARVPLSRMNAVGYVSPKAEIVHPLLSLGKHAFLDDGVMIYQDEFGGPIEFGLTAMDEIGNESDMVTLKAAYQFNVPDAPTDLYLRKVDDYYTNNVKDSESDKGELIELDETIGSGNSLASKPLDDIKLFDEIRVNAE